MELQTCPCCGGLPLVKQQDDGCTVVCEDCELQIKRPSKNLADVVEAWNRRVRLGYQLGQ